MTRFTRQLSVVWRRFRRWISVNVTGWDAPADEYVLVRVGDLHEIATEVAWLERGVVVSTKTSANVKMIVRSKAAKIRRRLLLMGVDA